MRTAPSIAVPGRLARALALLALAAAAGCSSSSTSAPACTYTYSAWGACQPGGTQTRTVLTTDPAGCSGTPATSQACTYVSSAFKLHYHRALADYAGWAVGTTAGAVEASVSSSSTDGFGAVYDLTVASGATHLDFTIASGATADAAGALSVDVSGATREVWVISGWKEAISRALPAIPGANQVAVYYARAPVPPSTVPDYTGWGLHTWGMATDTAWAVPLSAAGTDPEFGEGFLVNLKAPGGATGNCPGVSGSANGVCIIVHKGDTKDPGPDMGWDPAVLGNIVFLVSGSSVITSAPRAAGGLSIDGASAHLLSRTTLAWGLDAATVAAAGQYELRWSSTAAVAATATDVVGGSVITLTPRTGGLDAATLAKVPHMAAYKVFDVAPADLPALRSALKGQAVAVARKSDGTALSATQVQTPLALDDLYGYSGALGLSFAGVAGAPTFLLWAPTAQAVTLRVYGAGKVEVAGSPVTMTADSPAPGVWTASGPVGWYGLHYRFELDVYHPVSGRIEHVVVTDPYSANLSTNSAYSQIVDLADPALAPPNWSTFAKPALAAPEDIVVYESHVRDFSALDATVPAAHRGRYLAFTDQGSDGMRHLGALAAAGLTHVHLLPVFDIATVNEDPLQRVDVDQPFSALCAANSAVPAALCTAHAAHTVLEALQSYPGDSDQQQAIAGYQRNLDAYNWGYDPLHFGAPEGSYASTPEGTARIVEFRQMVMGLAQAGLRVVMDVVYNHTNASGLAASSVLDKVVPGYYHRRDPSTGFVLSSSCCANTATEHQMMGRLMNDTLVRWARDYQVDGFRFDLMGLHLKADVLAAQAALQAVSPEIYLYGEGWEMGEMQNNHLGTNANQANMAGTGVGTFNDRIRDGVRGGSPFDDGTKLMVNEACNPFVVCAGQGFATGLYLDSNEASGPATPGQLATLLSDADWIKVGMAGGLWDFRLQSSTGGTVVAGSIGYSGAHCGYTQQPRESVNYVSAHDNQTLWDIAQYKLPLATPAADRVRAHDLALDTILLGQGIPFVHMGDDLLRSKSEDKNSYDSGDWFNRIDWTGAGNGWKTGLPPQGDNGSSWTQVATVFSVAAANPGAAGIAAARAHFQEMLAIRGSSPLFRLRTGADVKKRVDFLNTGPAQVPGLIVMTVTDGSCAGADLDPARDALVVVVNADKVAHAFAVPGAAGFTLHPVQQASADTVVRGASFTAATSTFSVPARTTAVFQQAQSGAQGAGLPCNTR